MHGDSFTNYTCLEVLEVEQFCGQIHFHSSMSILQYLYFQSRDRETLPSEVVCTTNWRIIADCS